MIVYAFSTLGGRSIFDIDVFGQHGFALGGLIESYLHLFNFAGTSITENDDNSVSYGQAGSETTLDSYIETTLTSGNYFIPILHRF